MRLLLRCISGLESILEREVRMILGQSRSVITERPFPCAVSVSGPLLPTDVYRLHYTSRFVTHLWREIGNLDVNHTSMSEDRLFSFLTQVDYPKALARNTVAAFIRNPARVDDLSEALLARWKTFLADRYGATFAWDDYQVRLLLVAEKDHTFRVYAGDGHTSLHIRGLRKKQGVAPMNETLAAAMVSMVPDEAAGQVPVIDPFCGSGTIILEYLMRRCNVPAQYFNSYYRHFEQRHLRQASEAFSSCTVGTGFDEEEWRHTIEQEDSKISPHHHEFIAGFDKDPRMIQVAASNLDPLIRLCDISSVPLQAFDWVKLSQLYSGSPVALITNPPFGLRLTRSEKLVESIKHFLDVDGSTGVVAVGSPEDVEVLGCDPYGGEVTRTRVANVDTWLCKVVSVCCGGV
ncbi:hypothetical protein FOL47_008346 [Perkinsus chesapeaki]|uniref:Ribosomal RNA large subunit methyltransferase K/L-like methyltransferase domain-containing protein n=1 Tax=Perkinsus chesapeaki TaxID=330153 RepID=A0A7J6MTW1_PERCH|nr:hypothetical protein FOL47_008346 [Perkinsus chesapeaki]